MIPGRSALLMAAIAIPALIQPGLRAHARQPESLAVTVLANVRPGDKPAQLVGYTTFTSPSPFAVLPDSTVAVWWLTTRERNSWERPDYAQSLHFEEVKYRKRTPPSHDNAR